MCSAVRYCEATLLLLLIGLCMWRLLCLVERALLVGELWPAVCSSPHTVGQTAVRHHLHFQLGFFVYLLVVFSVYCLSILCADCL